LKSALKFHSNLFDEYAVCVGGSQAKERNFNFRALGSIGLRKKIKIWLCLVLLAPPLEKQRWNKEKSTEFFIEPVS
jgi:hypothetical protein